MKKQEERDWTTDKHPEQVGVRKTEQRQRKEELEGEKRAQGKAEKSEDTWK